MKLKGISKPGKANTKGTKEATRLVKKGVKTINKAHQKKVKKLESYAISYKKAQMRARDFVESMGSNFVISADLSKAIYSEAPDRMTKKKADELKKKISKSIIKRDATLTIKEWEKVIYETDIDPSTGNKITRQIPISSVAKMGKLDTPVLSNLSYSAVEQAKKDPSKSNKKLATSLNDMIDYQRNNFKTVDGQLIQKIWILAKDLAGGVPTTSNEFFSLRPYTENGKKKTFKYDPDPSKVKENMEAFYRSVHFKKLPGWALKNLEQIAQHPQTNPDLYEEFRKSSSLRSLAKNMAKLTQQASQQTGIPIPAVRVLMYLMETSQSWHIAARGTWDSDQVEANWIHIGRDLQMLELVQSNSTNDSAIDKIVASIMNAGRGVNVVSIMNATEGILKRNRMAYRNAGSYYYDPSFDQYK